VIGLSIFSSFQQTDAVAVAEGAPAFGRRDVPTWETLRDYLYRLEHELLWPRILVRNAPPQDAIQPNAPERPIKKSDRRAFSAI